ncbi:MAG: GIY-YIG nuclease family protein [Flavobacterium sp.]|nr:GIY-YIG nuclease family protein [Flavobacterium sp.]
MFYVYVLYSKILDIYYKGFSTNIQQRLEYPLNGKSLFTSQVKDSVLVYSKIFDSKKEALIEEKRLKKLNRTSIEKIINS